MVKIRVRIIGVDCPTCVYAIERNLSRVKGFRNLEADVTTGDAVIEYEGGHDEIKEIYNAIRSAGYDLLKEVVEVYIDVEPEEVSVIESKLLRSKGVFNAEVSSVSGLLRIYVNPLESSRTDVLRELEKLGVRPKGVGRGVTRERSRYEFLVRIAVFTLGLATIVYSMSSMLISEAEANTYVLMGMALTTLALSHSILVKGFKSLLNGAPVMESLISISSTLSFLFGATLVTNLLPYEHLVRDSIHVSSFFEASAGVLGFVSLGKYLEERLRYRALKQLRELEKALQGKARVVKDGEVKEVGVDEVSINDIVEVKAGEKVPVDGVVVNGWGYVDESAFTGESNPVLKRDEKRDYVLAGSILSTGYIKVRATRVGRDTVISHIAESAREAQLYKPEFQRFADRIVGFLTWIVIALAFSTSLIWYFITGNLHLALMFAASVLAVTCPCPLGIAIPMVISIGVLRASRNGILVRRGDVFERMVSADTLIFDKTGTLTIGKPRVTDVFVVNGDEDSLMKYVCSVEGRSEHQLANAILEYCNGKGHGNINEPSNYEYFPGLGVIGEVDGHYIVIGNLELMKRLNIDLSEEVLELVNKIGERGGTPILASVNEVIAGIIGVRDELREEVYEIVEFFKKSGFRTGIASGDIEANVKRVEKVIGADFSKAGLRPEDKASLMKEMESRGSRIVFVGDGVNDAIAIGSAFLGIAVGKATDIAKNAGDVVLVSSSLTKLKQLFNLSLKVKKRALENLAWAFIYNGLLIPIAAGVLYKSHGIMLKPEWAALSMILSDITVVLNSLRLVVERT